MENVELNESMVAKMASRVNLNKLSCNFVGAIRTTTNDCRVSFIDFYLVFPTNFRIVFLPHTNTVILLEPYCGTITEPGLPVVQSGGKYIFHCYFSFTFFLTLGAFISVVVRL